MATPWIARWQCFLWAAALAFVAANTAHAAQVTELRVQGVIGPASAAFIVDGIAAARNDMAVVIALDTPGGLDSSMRRIVQAILASPVPVVTYVHPRGARAASAGTYILYASHLAAMTPATNLGAATPVSIGPGGGDHDTTMGRKVTNDAAAYLRSLADLRGRNTDFAEQAVREAASMSATEALEAGVVDMVANDLPDLLRQMDGRTVQLQSGPRLLHTVGATVDVRTPDWRSRLLAVITNPQLALVLMMIGVYGLFIEFTSPGFGVPGVAGAICLLLALYAFQLLPVNGAGAALLALGAALMVAEAFLPSFGVIGLGGVVAFVLGGLFLFDQNVPGFGLSPYFLTGVAVAAALVIGLMGGMLLKSRARPVVSGREELLGANGKTVARGNGETWVQVEGELWRTDEAPPLPPDTPVRVTGIDGLVLHVTPTGTETTRPRN